MKFQPVVSFMLLCGFHYMVLSDDHPDTYLSTEELVQKYGYPIESHEVTTEDGYIITIFRIRHGKKGDGTNSKPILIMHGLFGQCENFIVNGMNNGSLAYLLADNGYDVWLGNTRGTQHGRKHKDLYPEDIEFWNFRYGPLIFHELFSWHEIGMYDIPAMIDFILAKTKKEKLQYVGHSQGGTVFFIMTSMKPEYQSKIHLASLLGPAGYMRHFRNLQVWPLVVMENELTALAKALNLHELPPPPIKLSDLVLNACKHTTFRIRQICELSYHFGIGGDSGLFRQEMLPLLSRFIPSAATKQPLHYSQGINSGHFRPWDYGEQENYEVYGQAVPPDYPIENISTPVAMYYGNNDIMASVEDIEEICEFLPNCVRRYLVPHPKFTHVDFLTATTLNRLMNIPLLEFLKKYET